VYTAPNLGRVHERIQWAWFAKWLQEPGTIQPGTKMPPWFPGKTPNSPPASAFAAYPEEARGPLEAMYGYTAKEQMSLLMDFIFVAGRLHYTPNSERITGQKKEVIELKPLPKPTDVVEAKPVAEKPAEESKPAETKPEAKPEVKPEAPAKPAAEEKAPVSSIELNEGVTDYKGSRVVGVIQFGGAVLPKKRLVNMAADAACVKQHGAPPVDPTMLVNADKSVSNVLVYVKSAVPADAVKKAAGGAMLDQRGCEYVPHVLGIVAGQPLRVWNNDPLLHNVRFESKQNGAQNAGMPAAGMKMDFNNLNKPEFGATFRCDVHPWMGAVLHVMPNQFFFVSDVQGRFEIKGLPPGSYEVGTWHERDGKGIKTKTASVTVEADKSTRLDIELSDK
jgi:hypothetical protein